MNSKIKIVFETLDNGNRVTVVKSGKVYESGMLSFGEFIEVVTGALFKDSISYVEEKGYESIIETKRDIETLERLTRVIKRGIENL